MNIGRDIRWIKEDLTGIAENDIKMINGVDMKCFFFDSAFSFNEIVTYLNFNKYNEKNYFLVKVEGETLHYDFKDDELSDFMGEITNSTKEVEKMGELTDEEKKKIIDDILDKKEMSDSDKMLLKILKI